MSFFDEPDSNFDALRTESQARFGLSVAYVKEQVGEGVTYDNEVARAVISASGGYCQLTEMPEEFVGAVGGLTHRLIGLPEAEETLRHVQALIEGIMQGTVRPRALSFYLLYAGGSLRQRQGMFVCDYRAGAEPFVQGAVQPETLPRFFKLRVQADADCAALQPLGITNGILLFLAPAQTDGSLYLLAQIDRQPQTVDLAALPTSATIN